MAIVSVVDLLRHLRFFVAVADERHFGHAADVLRMTQPPLSQGIQRLEVRWHLRLFDRGPAGVRLTAAGRALLPAARKLLEQADAIEAEAAELADDVPPFRLGLIAELGDLTPPLVAAIAGSTTRPVRPVRLTTPEAVSGIADRRLDLAVVRHPAVVDGATAGEVHVWPTVAVLAAHHPLADRGQVALAELDLPLAALPRSHHPAAYDQQLDALRRHGHPHGVRPVPSPADTLAEAASGTAFALITDDTAPVGLRRIELAGNPLPLRVRVLTPVLPDDPAGAERARRAAEAVLG